MFEKLIVYIPNFVLLNVLVMYNLEISLRLNNVFCNFWLKKYISYTVWKHIHDLSTYKFSYPYT